MRMTVDSKHIKEVLCGQAVLRDVTILPICRRVSERILTFYKNGRKPGNIQDDAWTWRPRFFNKDVDDVCNQVMDEGRDILYVNPRIRDYMIGMANLYISSDGGCRHKGYSSTGWLIRAVGPNEGGVTVTVLLARGGTHITKNLPSYIVELLAIDEVTNFLRSVTS